MTNHQPIDFNLVSIETVATLRQENRLLLPVAFATMLPGQFINDPASLAIVSMAGAPVALLLAIAAGILSIVGEGAIIALALGSGLSVREALRIGVRRMPAMIGALLLILLLAAALMLPVLPALANAVDAARAGNQAAVAEAFTPSQSFYLLGALLLLIWIGTRLTLLRAVIVIEKAGPWAALKRSYRLTGPVQWRLLFSLLGVLMMALLGIAAIGIALAVVLKLLGAGPEASLSGALILALVRSSLMVLVTLTLSVFLARLYHRLVIPFQPSRNS